MFCRNCGKEIPNGTNFCNHCGAAQNSSSAQDTQSAYQTNETQHSSVNSQSVYTAPAPQKPKRKGPLRIIIPIVVVAVAFVIGYFATGANKLKQPTAFDTPSSIEFDSLESPSIKDTTDISDASQENECKTFVIESDTARTYTKFFYGEDGIVETVSGAITVYDATVVDVSYLEDLREDAETASDLLKEMGVSNTSFVMVTEDAEGYDYSETFQFAFLEDHTDVAELAANFIGFEADNGRIMIDEVEAAMLGFGFTLQ